VSVYEYSWMMPKLLHEMWWKQRKFVSCCLVRCRNAECTDDILCSVFDAEIVWQNMHHVLGRQSKTFPPFREGGTGKIAICM